MSGLRGLLAGLLLLILAACSSSNSPSAAPPAMVAAPTALTYPAEIVGLVGRALTTVTPTMTGTATSFSVSGTLPAGLAFSTTTGAISGTPTALSMIRTLTVTASNASGSTTAKTDIGVSDTPTNDVEITSSASETPVVALSISAPVSGESVAVTVALAGATKIVLTPSGGGCGGFAAQTVSAATLTQTATVAATGRCGFAAQVTTATGTTTYTNEFTIRPTSLPGYVGGLSFAGGAYFPSGEVASLPASTSITVTGVTAPAAFVNGGSGSIFVTGTGLASATRAIVSFAGFPGYFVVPVTMDGGRVRIDLNVAQTFIDALTAAAPSGLSALALGQPRPPAVEMVQRGRIAAGGKVYDKPGGEQHAAQVATETLGSSVGVTVRLMDARGGASGAGSASLDFQRVNAGTLQFSLRWDLLADVDLHVVTPASGEIYYSRKTDGAGGSLDLDSNAGCSIDRINNENVSWTSTPPATGTYTVRVDHWSACAVTTLVHYVLTVSNCGVRTTYEGNLSPNEADRGGAGAGRTVATINYTGCAGLSVSGKATYEDRRPIVTSGTTPATANLPATGTAMPIRYAAVEVRKVGAAVGDTPLGRGFTDETGQYFVRFTMPTPGPYHVAVLSQEQRQETVSTPAVRVAATNDTVYVAQSAMVDASQTANATNVAVLAKASDGSASPFNIFDVMILNLRQAATIFASGVLPALKVIWETNYPGCGATDSNGTLKYVSCYDIREARPPIKIKSSSTDPDENDDSVLSHEFGHFVIRTLSADKSSGGTHGFNLRSSPLLAWSEGVATFWGQSALNDTYYADTKPGGGFAVYLETPESFVPSGTFDGTFFGNLSESWVYAILWDLADGGVDTAINPTNAAAPFEDRISSPIAVFNAIFALKTATHDRGVAGPDLVDFLDQYLCPAGSTWNPAGTSDFRGLVVGLDKFPYAPDRPTASPPIGNCS